MTIGELKNILERFDDDKDVMIFNENTSSLDDIGGISINNGNLQLDIIKTISFVHNND